MTIEQKNEIIRMYNVAHERQCEAEDMMDEAITDKAWNNAANEHSFALGEQAGIDRVLQELGFALILDDERAVDIVEE